MGEHRREAFSDVPVAVAHGNDDRDGWWEPALVVTIPGSAHRRGGYAGVLGLLCAAIARLARVTRLGQSGTGISSTKNGSPSLVPCTDTVRTLPSRS